MRLLISGGAMSEVRSLSIGRYLSLASNHLVARTFWIATFAILTALGAQVEIPHQPVPFTLQTFFVLLAGALLGPRNGFLSMSLYLLLGISGLPVFSGGGFGFARIVGPTGGYLLAFPLAAFVIGWFISLRGRILPLIPQSVKGVGGYGWTLVSMLAGLLLIFACGTFQLNAVYFNDWASAFQAGFLIFSWWDVLKLVAATAIAQEFLKRIDSKPQ
jgi:biotin transport system substrate-specific component